MNHMEVVGVRPLFPKPKTRARRKTFATDAVFHLGGPLNQAAAAVNQSDRHPPDVRVCGESGFAFEQECGLSDSEDDDGCGMYDEDEEHMYWTRSTLPPFAF